jgi:uncharacterized membrane protein
MPHRLAAPLAALPTAYGLAVLFLLYGLIAAAVLSRLLPPFQNPDEPAHYLRAAQIADGRLLADRQTRTDAAGAVQTIGGGLSDPAILAAEARFDPLIGTPAARDNAARWRPPVTWSKRHREFLGFPNTAMYPPQFYLPAAAGVAIGRRAHLSVARSLEVSRLLTGVCAAALGAVAVACAGAAAVWLFAVLCLPMSLSLMASAAQDGLMLTASALAGCLFIRLARTAPAHPARGVALLGLALGSIAMARPPYILLALLPLALEELPWRLRLLGAAIAAGLGAAWSLVVLATSMTDVGGFVGADPAAQAAWLLRQPWQFAAILTETLLIWWKSLVVSFVGQLGWLTVALPPAYHAAALGVLALAALATALGGGGGRLRPRGRLLVLVALLAASVAMFAIQYLTWTPPHHPWVAGVQGRYFLPLALAGIGVLPGLPRHWRSDRLRAILIGVVAVFPVVTLAVTVQAVVERYYLADG